LQRVHDSATRSAHLVNQLLTLARAEPESAMVQDRQRFDLNRLAQTLTAEWVPRALRLGVDLGLADSDVAPAPAVWVLANPLLISEALSNVIDNALHYAGPSANPHMDSAPQVTVRVRSDEGRALLEVLDNGPGIAQADQARVFERFVRATDSGNGCGLGLAIVKEIIERHGGEVRLSDAAPHGLHVRMWLPLAEPA
jgi:two-component system sensor histidine kinase TctE